MLMKIILEFIDLSKEQLQLMKNAEAILSELGFSMKRKYVPQERTRLWCLDQKYVNDKSVNVYIIQEDGDDNIMEHINDSNLLKNDISSSNNGIFNFKDEKDSVDNEEKLSTEFSIKNFINNNEVEFSDEMNENLNKLDIAVNNIINHVIENIQYEEEMEYNLQKEEFLNNIENISFNDNEDKKDNIIKLLYDFIGDDDIKIKIQEIIN